MNLFSMYLSCKIYNADYFFLSQEILYCYGETMSTVGVISKVFSYLDRTPKCEKAGELAPEKLEGRVVFQNVSFTYPSAPSDKPALKVTVWQADSTSLTWCPEIKIVFWIVSNINLESDEPQLHNRIINMFCTVCFYGASAREDDSTGRPLRQREVFLRQPPEEAVRTSGGTDPAGWRTAAPLQTQIPPSKGTIKSPQQIKKINISYFLLKKMLLT